MKILIAGCGFLITLYFAGCSSDTTGPAENGPVSAFSMDIGSSGEIFIITGNGLFRSLDNGETWNYLKSDYYKFVSVNPSGTIYIMSSEKIDYYNHNETLWYSIDSGRTFNQTGWIKNNISWLEGMSWLTSDEQGNLFAWAGAYPGKLLRGDPSGQSWTEILSLENTVYVPTENFIIPNNAFITLYDGVYREINGNYWKKVLHLQDSTGEFIYSEGALAYNTQNRIFAAVRVTPQNDSTVTGMIYHSDDNGDSWIKGASFNSPVTHLAVNTEDKIFAITELHEVYSSIDNGSQWNKVSVDFPETQIQKFIISPNKKLFILTTDGKIYRSQNEGINWQKI